MSSEELMNQIEVIFKKAITNKLLSFVEITDDVAKSITVNILYAEIMSLGLTFGSIEKALSEIQKSNDKMLGNHVYDSLKKTSKKYSELIKVFSQFYLELENGLSGERLIENVILNLSKLK